MDPRANACKLERQPNAHTNNDNCTETDDKSATSEKKGYLDGKSRVRVSDLREAKLKREKWAMLTCYDTVSAKIFDHAKIPCLLVGDSAAQTVYGYSSTIPITMDELIPLARAVSSSCHRALVIADLPFGSYQESPQVALKNATRLMKESLVHGVKLEGGKVYAEHVRLLTQSGIPVMAHIGFTPQSEHTLSGFKVQGRNQQAIDKLCEDSLVLQGAGAFACVLELMPAEVGRAVTNHLEIPTVGIGAGPHCDAQILVWHDMAGFTPPRCSQSAGYLSRASSDSAVKPHVGSYRISDTARECNSTTATTTKTLELNNVPKFVKRYANLSEILYNAAISYANDVITGAYPGAPLVHEASKLVH